MTKIWLLSDLHQEFIRDPEEGRNPLTAFRPEDHVPDDFDVVVLAGDIDVPLTREVEFARTRFPGVPVILTAGNHSFFKQHDLPPYTLWEQLDQARELADKHGIHLLEDGQVTIGDTRFIGATLWTDFLSVGYGSAASRISQARGRRGMNDYRDIKRFSSKRPGARRPLRPEDTIAIHKRSRAYIEATLAEPFEGSTVVVTHHAPHHQSLDPAFHDLNWCYSSNLTDILEGEHAPDLWVHGHIHRPVDYMVGKTRIASNPRGYAFYDKNPPGFRPSLVLDAERPEPDIRPPRP